MKIVRQCLIVLIAALLAVGCSGGTIRKETPSNKVAQAVEPDLIVARAEILGKAAATFKKDEEKDYVMIGYNLADRACADYFDRLILASNKLRMSKADVTAVGTAAATIMSLAKSTAQQIGIAAAAFGLGSTVLDNVQQYLYITPYPEETRALVETAMEKYRTNAPPDIADSLEVADDMVSGYARLCTYANIAQLAKSAIAKSKVRDDAKGKAPVESAEDALVLDSAKAMLGLQNQPVTDEQWAKLAAIGQLSNAADAEQRQRLVETLPESIQSAISKGSKPTTAFTAADPLLRNLAAKNSDFAASVKRQRDAAAGTAASSAFNESVPVKSAPPVGKRPYVRPHIVIDSR